MENFNHEGHRKLWLLLAKKENIQRAVRQNYSGNGYYNAYGALEKLKKELLIQHFSAEERNPKNYCYACQAALLLYQEENWIDDDEIHCDYYCPLQWPNDRSCDEDGSLYHKLVDHLQANDVDGAAAVCVEIANLPVYTEEEIEKRISGKGDCYEF